MYPLYAPSCFCFPLACDLACLLGRTDIPALWCCWHQGVISAANTTIRTANENAQQPMISLLSAAKGVTGLRDNSTWPADSHISGGGLVNGRFTFFGRVGL